MILKRGAVLMLSVFMLTALAGCKPPAKQEAKETLPKVIEKDEPKWRSISGNELEELYPELKEIKTYLFEQYPDIFINEEQLLKEEKKITYLFHLFIQEEKKLLQE